MNNQRLEWNNEEMTEKVLADKLRRCQRWSLSYATNTIILRFFESSANPDPTYWFAIDPPWLFNRGNKIIQNSNDCPASGHEASMVDYRQAFSEWCSLAKSVKELGMPVVQLSQNGLLTFHWDEGFELIVTADSFDEESWTFFDELSGETYHGYRDRIEKSLHKES
ncbi:MAG: hypothetical protein CVV45_15925 [Spirochaetae bacterium HGW-Spirochaetae-10]|nr:MAG: hypothetical protein CVV45_15925 [Spirochaetae bacterium HGW-Spirochaetae-10]